MRSPSAWLRRHIFHEHSSAPLILAPLSGGGAPVKTDYTIEGRAKNRAETPKGGKRFARGGRNTRESGHYVVQEKKGKDERLREKRGGKEREGPLPGKFQEEKFRRANFVHAGWLSLCGTHSSEISFETNTFPVRCGHVSYPRSLKCFPRFFPRPHHSNRRGCHSVAETTFCHGSDAGRSLDKIG